MFLSLMCTFLECLSYLASNEQCPLSTFLGWILALFPGLVELDFCLVLLLCDLALLGRLISQRLEHFREPRSQEAPQYSPNCSFEKFMAVFLLF
jgi:hypothetical protein